MAKTERDRELLAEARAKWGWIARKHGLAIVDATEDHIWVAGRGPEKLNFMVSKTMLKYVRNINWPFAEAAHRIGATSVRPGTSANL
jgi:hypothetical protein